MSDAIIKRRERLAGAWILLGTLASAVNLLAQTRQSTGVISGGVFVQAEGPIQTSGAAEGARILLFNSTCELCDGVDDIKWLGGRYVITSNPDDLNVSYMKTFDIVWIGTGAGFANWGGRCGDIIAYLAAGKSLVIGQPNEAGIVPCLPPELRVVVISEVSPFFGLQVINAPDACVVRGLTNAQLPGHHDLIPSSLLGPNWTKVTVEAETPDYAAILYARAPGQILLTDMCAGTGTPQSRCSLPASPQFLDQLIGCMRNGVPQATCDIQFSKQTFVTGDTVMADNFHLANPSDHEIAVELKAWLELAPFPPQSLLNIGAYGLVRLPPNSHSDTGPFSLFSVTPATPRQMYGVHCRVLGPVTGETLFEDFNTFHVRE